MSKEKYHVTLPEKTAKILTDLSEQEQVSKPEIMRRAIAMYSYIHKELGDSGNKFCILGENGNLIKEVVFQ